jgi:hypothetical protein
MQSHLYFEDGPLRRPGILVFPEAYGLNQHAKTQARRLEELGYIALACDLHGEGKLFEDLQSVGPIIEGLSKEPAHIRVRAKGGLDALVARPEVDASRAAAVGYCFGGTMALELARGGNPIVGVVGFHSGLATVAPQDARNIKGKVWSVSARMIRLFLLSNESISRTRCETVGLIGRWTSMEVWCTVSPILTLTKQVGRKLHVTTPEPLPVPGQRCARFSRRYSGDEAADPAHHEHRSRPRRRPRPRGSELIRRLLIM